MSTSVGCGFDESSETACMICPGWQYPHCETFTSAHAFCTACGPCAEMPSMVVICNPPTVPICFEHDRTALPSCSTVHAPQSAMPQPNFVPVSPRMSRRYHSSGISGSPSNVCDCPFTLKCTMGHFPVEIEFTPILLAKEKVAVPGLGNGPLLEWIAAPKPKSGMEVETRNGPTSPNVSLQTSLDQTPPDPASHSPGYRCNPRKKLCFRPHTLLRLRQSTLPPADDNG